MMLIPCWPRAGPTGGAGLAAPPIAWSLMVVRTFLAMGSIGPRSGPLLLLYLVEADLDGGLPAEDRDEHLQAAGVLVDLGDLARGVRQRPGDDLDRLADRELGAGALAHRHLLVQEAIDLTLGERDRLVGGPDEAGHPRGALDQAPGVLV